MTNSPRLPSPVGVLGGGRMGVGIAHAFLVAGSEVVVVERSAPEAAAATERLEKALLASVERGTLDNLDVALERVRVDTDPAAFADCELVVEAVPEDLDLKIEALRRVEAAVAPGTRLASNTSSLSIDALAEQLARPADVIGLHFFNPVPASSLVEIVKGAQTSPEVVQEALGWVEAIGKTPIVAANTPGFATSRLGMVIALEAMRMLEEGVASAADIDTGMQLGYRHQTGPLRTSDVVGLDVRLHIAEYLHATLGERFAPPQILRDHVAAGRLGRKTGSGFYEW